MPRYAFPCPCGHSACKNWMVSEVADIQGVSFTEQQARAVAGLLNFMEEQKLSSRPIVNTLLQFQDRS